MRGTALCCAAVVCGGCSLLLSTSDLAEPPSDGGTAIADGGDGATPTGDAAVDAPIEAADAGADGGPFCASLSPAPKFCSDFDNPNATILSQWTRLFVDPPGVGVAEKSDVARAGKSASVRMSSAPNCSYTRLEKDFATTGKDLRMSFWVRPTTPWLDDVIYAFVRLGASSTACSIFLHLGSASNKPAEGPLHFQYGSPMVDQLYDMTSYPKEDVWSKVEIRLRANASIVVSVDGVVARDMALGGCVFGDSVTVGLGYNCEAGSPEVRYDDVVVDYP